MAVLFVRFGTANTILLGSLSTGPQQAMVSKPNSGPIRQQDPGPDSGSLGSCTLHVCTSCRPPGTPREPREDRPGFKLYQELCSVLQESSWGHRVEIKPAECLSLCPRPCGIALSSNGAWSYLFGDQQPNETTEDIVKCVVTYIHTQDGHMPRGQRPKPLRASILGRVPPIDG